MFRTILKANRRKLQLTLPKKYVGRNIEVLVFPVDSNFIESKLTEKCFATISLKTIGFKFNRDEANER